ncbi:helix-turn-helix domain-containing protein [Streptomyces sp. NPDC059255]|uniref:helix-turn-helix domain-containing protein n=1 Tax=Streptomyces sp. NPDC059255 TaxID=3346793 RepID=UPI0036B13510
MAGRRENPVDPAAGPAQYLAHELRALRESAGSPTYRAMALRTGFGASTLSQAAAGERLPTLPVLLAYVEACDGDREDWQERWRRVTEEEAGELRPDDTTAAPYRGLARFETQDERLFFGRDQLTDDLVHQTRRSRLTAIVGPSGSGKSSLLRAGLIPRLRRTSDSADTQASARPGTEPGAPLITAPASTRHNSPEAPPAALRVLTPGSHPLRTHGPRLTPADTDPAGGDTWLIVDQFEELYTLCRNTNERIAFIDRLLAAREPDSRLRVVIAVRADFFGRLAEHPGLAEALRDATLLAAPMSTGELRQAIVKPAQEAGLIVERELTTRLLSEVEGEPGGLPLMSHALLETWRRRRSRALTVAAYEAAGGLHGAVA